MKKLVSMESLTFAVNRRESLAQQLCKQETYFPTTRNCAVEGASFGIAIALTERICTFDEEMVMSVGRSSFKGNV